MEKFLRNCSFMKETFQLFQIIVCCIDCFIFTLSYVSAEEKMVKILNEIDCMFVAYDYSGFDDTENYIGNEHILNATLTNKERRNCI